jgi:thiosulfate dehydrogenase
MGSRGPIFAAALVLALGVGACSHAACETFPSLARSRNSGPLISSTTTMVTAWDVPRNPLLDASLDDSRLSKDIRWGFQIFTNTPAEAPRFTPSKISCNNCHLNAGQREKSLPLVGVAGMFPEYNRRSGRLYTLPDRIVDCFLRSQNATGRLASDGDDPSAGSVLDVSSVNSEKNGEHEILPTTTSKEVLALAAYITWLARGFEVGKNPTWRGQNFIAPASLIPIDKLDPQKGETLFMERCTSCHGTDGQGVAVGDKKPGPLWGPDSWNDGAGASRVYTLAGIIRYAMPYLDPGSLTDEEAQQLAAFINSKPRPAYPFKSHDYLTEKIPVDSVYYSRSPLRN